ncbi:MAG: hypothetical protein VKJ02_18645 [Snowella sp.]|nr:hypothetical protein [Snowella sp.]
MNNLKKAIAIVSVLGLGSVLAAPAHADQAYASGSSAIVLMNGASQSVGAEIAAPSGTAFDSATGVLVTPALVGDLSDNTVIFNTLTVDAGAVAAAAGLADASFTAAAAAALNATAVLEQQVSIIRAGAGVDGLD